MARPKPEVAPVIRIVCMYQVYPMGSDRCSKCPAKTKTDQLVEHYSDLFYMKCLTWCG